MKASMKITAQQYAQALHETLEQTGEKDQDTVIDNLVKVLEANNQTGLYEDIIKEYELLTQKLAGIKQVNITTATDTDEKEIIDNLNKLVGKDINLTKTTDSDIIGGVVIKVDDTLIDGSIKTQLDNLQDKLKE